MANYILNNKKKALLARKEKLLEEIQYYEKRITDFLANDTGNSYFECESSDSDTDSPIFIDTTPPESLLKLQQAAWQTSLLATQELTGLEVLQSEINVLTEEPCIEDGAAVQKAGLWHAVALRCRVDRVPFGITFLMHQADGKFGARSYRNVTLVPEKAAHESELSKSVLNLVTTPSDALDVVKSYAAAHRSRRTTLARLAEKYADSLFMEPVTDGGYILKCAGLLEVCWTIVNRWSPLSQFQHRMKFELEYMDESYIKIITHLHRQLSDPSLETDERTLLLSKIISTCLEAKAPTQELYESMESDPETAQKLRKRRTTLDQEVGEPVLKKKKDNEVMAPPQSLPKKTKPKGKENDLKRPSAEGGGTSKKMKLTDVSKSVNKGDEINSQNERKNTKVDKVTEKIKGNKKIMTEVTNTQNVDNLKEKTNTNPGENVVNSKNKRDENNPKSFKQSKVDKNMAASKKNDEIATQSHASKSATNNVDEDNEVDKSSKLAKNNNVHKVATSENYNENALHPRQSKSTNEKNSKSLKKNNVQNIATTGKNFEEALQPKVSRPTNKNDDDQTKSKSPKYSNVQNVAATKKNGEKPMKPHASKSSNKNDDIQNKTKSSKNSNVQNIAATKKNSEEPLQPHVSKSSNNDQNKPKSSKKSNVQNVVTGKIDEEVLQFHTSKRTNNDQNKPKSSKKSNVQNVVTGKNDEEVLQSHTSKRTNKNIEQNKPNTSNKNNAHNGGMTTINSAKNLQTSPEIDNNNVVGQTNPKVTKNSVAQKNTATSKNNDRDILQAGTSKSAKRKTEESKNTKVSRQSNVQKNVTTTKSSNENATEARASNSTNNVVKEKLSNNKNTGNEIVNKENINKPVTNAIKSSQNVKKDSNKLNVNEKKYSDAVKDKNGKKNNVIEKNIKSKDTLITTSKPPPQNDKVAEQNKKVAPNSNLEVRTKEKVVKKMEKVTNNIESAQASKVTQENKVTKLIQTKGKLVASNKMPAKTQSYGNQKVSRIPQKKSSAPVSIVKKNPLRISPRKLPSSLKKQDGVKKMQKSLASIPQLLKKQMPKK